MGAACVALSGAALCALPSSAQADAAAYCTKVRARAAADAALLTWPKLTVEGVRFASASEDALGPTLGDNIQLRFGLSLSLVDVYRGVRTSRTAEAECDLHAASAALEDVVRRTSETVALPALRAQAAYLQSHRPEWRDLLTRARAQLGVGAITLPELQEVRRMVGLLERRLESVSGERDRLEALAPARASTPIAPAADAFVARAEDLERQSARLRALDAWDVKLSGAVIPFPGSPVDWVGLVQVSYSLGDVPQRLARTRYVEARIDELKRSPYELPGRAAEIQSSLLAEVAKARRELEVVEAEVSSIAAAREKLENTRAMGVEHALGTLVAEQLSLEADRVYLTTLIEALSARVGEGTAPEDVPSTGRDAP
jgi:hypothetical protein